MIRVCLMLPVFEVPDFATAEQIRQEFSKMTGFLEARIYHCEHQGAKISEKEKKEGKKYVGVEALDMKINFKHLARVAEKLQQFERENQILKKDLAEIAEENLKLTQKLGLNKSSNHAGFSEGQVMQEQSQERASFDDKEELQGEIHRLVRLKLQHEETIQKLTVYCEELLRIVGEKKITTL